MTVTLNLNPDVEAGLSALANVRGVSLSDHLEEIAAREACSLKNRHPLAPKNQAGKLPIRKPNPSNSPK